MVKVKKLGHVAIEVTDVKRAEAFYRDILGLRVSDELDLQERYGIDGPVVFMRSDADHHCSVLFPRLKGSAEGPPADSRLNHIAFEVERLEDLLDAASFLGERGVAIVRGPGQHFPGSNYYLDLLDPDGNRIQLFCGMEQVGWDAQSKPKASWRDREQLDPAEVERPWRLRPRKLGHLGIFVTDTDRSRKFYTEVLGLEVSDVNEQGIISLRCGADHHDTVLVPLSPDQVAEARQGRREIQQISYEVRDVEEIYRAYRFLREKGVTIVIGPRRRGPGHDNHPGLPRPGRHRGAALLRDGPDRLERSEPSEGAVGEKRTARRRACDKVKSCVAGQGGRRHIEGPSLTGRCSPRCPSHWWRSSACG